MQDYALEEAQNQLDDLLQAAMRGETNYIKLNEQQKVQLVPIASPKQGRVVGTARGLINMADDFDAPLSDFVP